MPNRLFVENLKIKQWKGSQQDGVVFTTGLFLTFAQILYH